MNIISKKDEGKLLALFIRNGYVLDFSTNEFDIFTTNSIGEALCSKYNLSKGKSLVQYLNSASDESRTKILMDLFEYYEKNMEYEYNSGYQDDSGYSYINRYDEKYSKLYMECRLIVRNITGEIPIIQTANELKEKFSSEYLSNQINLMLEMQTKNPTEAIGKSKELIESCCKTILDELEIPWSKSDDVPALTNKVMSALSLLPNNVNTSDPAAAAVRGLLGNLRAIPIKLAEIRNTFGSGHGKESTYIGLDIRHAKLAVGACIIFVDFIWNTFESNKRC